VLLRAVTGCNHANGVRDDVLWLKVVKLASTTKSDDGTDFPYGKHPGHFQLWCDSAGLAAVPLLQQLIDTSLRPSPRFSSDLIPPPSVMEHILEFAMESHGYYFDESYYTL